MAGCLVRFDTHAVFLIWEVKIMACHPSFVTCGEVRDLEPLELYAELGEVCDQYQTLFTNQPP